MTVEVRFFASLVDSTGAARDRVELPAGSDVSVLWRTLIERYPALETTRIRPLVACDVLDDLVDLVLLFRELPDARVKVSLRSKDELDVHGLAAGFGGCDRPRAAGRRPHRAPAARPGESSSVKRHSRFILSVLAFGYAFLYIPLVSVVIYSFNDSRLATVWGGFSTRWYGELLRNDEILTAALQ